jgi:hypothetical protein
MKLQWVIDEPDVAAMRALVTSLEQDPFVQLRQRRNLGQPRPTVSKQTIWLALVGCLLTTQQRSSPGSPIKRFQDLLPFPLAYDTCRERADLEAYARVTLTNFGGIRRAPTIARELQENFCRLEAGIWPQLIAVADHLNTSDDRAAEREAAHFLDGSLKGIGPKQSRNLLQWLGVTKYEIPIDSRVTKWLNNRLLAFRLSATVLADSDSYDMVSDGIQALCQRATVYPCIFDAAVFASYDKGGWTEEDLASESLLGA